VEGDESNNGLAAAAPIGVFRPDLIVPLVTAPTVWSTGQPFTVTARVRNQGLPPAAAGAFRVGAYLSTEPEPGTGILVGSVAVASLNPQTNASVTIPVAIPAFIAPGSYSVSVVADYEQRVAESNEGNNGLTAFSPVEIRRADLLVTAITAPATGSIGKTIAVGNTVKNEGMATIDSAHAV